MNIGDYMNNYFRTAFRKLLQFYLHLADLLIAATTETVLTMADTNRQLSPYVTLVSQDGFEFHVRRSAACVSGTIRRMLDVQSEPHKLSVQDVLC